MRKNLYRENEIIEQTRQVIQSFYGRKTESTIAPMSEDFMWIGSNDFQWCEGIDEFIQVTKKEYQEVPGLLSDEEFHMRVAAQQAGEFLFHAGGSHQEGQ